MKHNEHDAARALCDTAELQMLGTVDGRDPLEQTQRMPVADRRYRMHEGCYIHENARGPRHARAMLNNPVYRAQEYGRTPQGWPDFRDYYRGDMHPLVRAQMDGFPDDK
jgi:hypothetical protein